MNQQFINLMNIFDLIKRSPKTILINASLIIW
jgi:hypothetical protein